MEVSINEDSQNAWFTMENPITKIWMIYGEPHFRKPPYKSHQEWDWNQSNMGELWNFAPVSQWELVGNIGISWNILIVRMVVVRFCKYASKNDAPKHGMLVGWFQIYHEKNMNDLSTAIDFVLHWSQSICLRWLNPVLEIC